MGFMVTENKQSIYYQNKTQAYYYAKSGVEIVETALIEKLYSFDDNTAGQKAFVDTFNSPVDITISELDFIKDYPVIVKNEMINGKRILTITSTVQYKDITQTVKKGIYSTASMISTQGFLPGPGELFIYLGDVVPQELLNNGKSRNIPSEYVTKVLEDEKDDYGIDPLPTSSEINLASYINDYDQLNYNSADTKYYINAGTYTVTQNIYVNGNLDLVNNITFNGDFNIYVDGDLSIDNTVTFNGKTDIFVSGTAYFGSNTDLVGSKSNSYNQVRIYVYNNDNDTVSVENFNFNTTANNGKFRVNSDIFVEDGDVNLGFPQDSQIDGHLTHNGPNDIRIKTNSNSYNDRLITGSVYAPLGTVHLGIETYQVATILGGQVIADSINVYPGNENQGNKFYENSTDGRIENNPIPIDISDGIDTNTIRYESFFISN